MSIEAALFSPRRIPAKANLKALLPHSKHRGTCVAGPVPRRGASWHEWANILFRKEKKACRTTGVRNAYLSFKNSGVAALAAVLRRVWQKMRLTEPTLTRTSAPLNDLILPESVSSELDQLVIEFRKRDMLEQHRLSPRQRVLLAGPPGTGKTISASALAGELKLPLYSVLLHGLISKFMGETASKLNAIFEAVRTQRGVYLFDEIDALAAAEIGTMMLVRPDAPSTRSSSLWKKTQARR